MISMTTIHLGALRCPIAVGIGTAEVAFGAGIAGGAGMSWSGQRQQSVLAAKHRVDLVPPFSAYNTTSVSAPPERSP